MSEAKYTQLYIDYLKEVKKIEDSFFEKKIKNTTECNNLYLLSFMGLIRENYPYTIREDDEISNSKKILKNNDVVVVSKKDKKKKKKTSAEEQALLDNPDDPTAVYQKKDSIIVIFIDKEPFECRESELRQMFGDETYDKMFNPKRMYEIEKQNKQIYLPPWNDDEDGVDVNNVEPPEETKAKTSKETAVSIPFVESDSRYPDDPIGKKGYDTFLFNEHNITITMPDTGKQYHFYAVVYPINMTTEDQLISDIFMYMQTDDHRIRTAVSSVHENDTKAISASFNECDFIVRGSWKNGRFNSSINIVDRDEIKPIKQEQIKRNEPTMHTSTFYQRIKGNDGTYIDVFPVTLLKNNPETGLAISTVVFEDGYTRKTYVPTGNNCISLWFDGSQKDINIYWQGNDLICDITESKNKLMSS